MKRFLHEPTVSLRIILKNNFVPVYAEGYVDDGKNTERRKTWQT